MNKKFLTIGAILILLGLGGGGYYLYSQQKKLNLSKPTPGTKFAPKIFTKEYKDENVGFSFKYPENFKLDPHDEDKINYAHVEIKEESSKSNEGSIIIWAKDPPLGSLDEFIKKDKELGQGVVIETKWGGIDAQKISLKGEKPKIITTTVYDDLLFLAEVYPTDKGKELEVYDGILANFKFQSLDQAIENPPVVDKTKVDTNIVPPGGQQDSTEEEVEYEEEVVE